MGGICCLGYAIVGCIGIDGGRADLCGVMPMPWWRRVDRSQDDGSRQVMAQCFQQQELTVFMDFQLLGDARAHAAFGQQVGEEGRRLDGGRLVARVQQQAACLGFIVRMGPCQREDWPSGASVQIFLADTEDGSFVRVMGQVADVGVCQPHAQGARRFHSGSAR